MARQIVNQDLLFFEQLKFFYDQNKKKIRSRYNTLTKKFLAYNDPLENPHAFLRIPQFEALEIYIFIKEFLNNASVAEIFDDWNNRQGKFTDQSYYSIHTNGQGNLLDIGNAQNMQLMEQVRRVSTSYPNYIYALTMGLGKTILMATCIFYEFLLANKYPKDKRYCHNALVFAPDKTVLQSLYEIQSFDKSKVVMPEYVHKLDNNIHFHFLDESGTILSTLDDSDFNVVISNTQKIIVKKNHKEATAIEKLFSNKKLVDELATVYGDNDENELEDDADLLENQRFKKLCRLSHLGVYVDEAHHLFGKELEKDLSGKGGTTTLRDTINLLATKTSIVACFNYTGTPYTQNQILPEVVYAYGLRESIRNNYLKDADPIAMENVKSEEFLRGAIEEFWKRYGNKTFEGLKPKFAIYAATVEEAVNEVKPAVEQILVKLGIPLDSILVNVGDNQYTKDSDIRNFHNLDKINEIGNDKQFIILVEKGKEGWNCRSLFGIALFRNPKSKIFVLQATMRCLRSITKERQRAVIFLSKDNFHILDTELKKNFNITIRDLNVPKETKPYRVTVVPPERTFSFKKTITTYSLVEKKLIGKINFDLKNLDLGRYKSVMYERESIARDISIKEVDIDYLQDRREYSLYTLVAEIACYLNKKPSFVQKILEGSVDGIDCILECVNKYNQILYDILLPKIFDALYKVEKNTKEISQKIVLLRSPAKGYFDFLALPELVICKNNNEFSKEECEKSFHADIYCFDSKPEKECFNQYITNKDVSEIYFTGMFTSNQGDLVIPYFDPESERLRNYYPDFLAVMRDGGIQLIEVKGDNMIDDIVVKAKAEAAKQMASINKIQYVIYKSSDVMSKRILES